MKLTAQKKGIMWTILGISMFQMGMVALSPVISSITVVFPNASQLIAQMATTFLNLVLVIAALFSGQISKAIGRRMMCTIGLSLFVISAVGGYFCTFNVGMVYVWSALLGAGTGLFVPSISSMMVDYFEPEETAAIAGYQTSAVNLGGVILSILSGIVANARWNSSYLVYLLAFPIVIMCLKFLPKQDKSQVAEAATESKEKAKMPFIVFAITAETMAFAICYFAFSTNASLLLTERNVTNTSVTGIATGVFMFGGCVVGFLFNKIMSIMKKNTDVFAFVLLAISYALIYFVPTMPVLMIGAFIGGGSLSIIFPYALLRIGGKVEPAVTVTATAWILSVGPNFGSFLSPLVLTNLANIMGRSDCSFRFFLAAVIAVILGVIVLFCHRKEAD